MDNEIDKTAGDQPEERLVSHFLCLENFFENFSDFFRRKFERKMRILGTSEFGYTTYLLVEEVAVVNLVTYYESQIEAKGFTKKI